MRSKTVIISIATVVCLLSSCRTAPHSHLKDADALAPPLKMGLRDVSFYLNPAQLLPLSTPTEESLIFPREMFEAALKLADGDKASAFERAQFERYEDWMVAAVRIDSCAKLLPDAPCEAQIRLVLQPFERSGSFRDQAIHLAFNIEDDKKLAMLQDFVNLKRGESGLGNLIRKWALLSKLNRVAVMLTINRVWSFAASQVVKEGKIEAAPIPCIGKTKVDFVASGVAIHREFPRKIDPENRCSDLHANRLLTEDITGGVWSRMSPEEKEKDPAIALRINDPDKVFFASTDCVSCHVAGRALYRVKGEKYLRADPKDPNRYRRPDDMQDQGELNTVDHINAWGTRAFGYGQDGKSKAMSLYTFHDSLRVAHEINELIRTGQLK